MATIYKRSYGVTKNTEPDYLVVNPTFMIFQLYDTRPLFNYSETKEAETKGDAQCTLSELCTGRHPVAWDSPFVLAKVQGSWASQKQVAEKTNGWGNLER